LGVSCSLTFLLFPRVGKVLAVSCSLTFLLFPRWERCLVEGVIKVTWQGVFMRNLRCEWSLTYLLFPRVGEV
ncbi:unnamed protein product, partial [Staurois parvus]